ncbi:replication factor C small subunit [archaeon]|jgi:replication factor C small subunit|nr:replication factor C small subunit [archaeon]MBT4397659.1 replication factor C small subunit [archaeon]MBT4441645.1 replication factor C small subunit [archaeon]
MSSIWTEKYRPHSFEDIKGQKQIVERVKAFVDQKNMPHLLFSGPAGVGKSTLALIVARQLFKESWKQNFLELNASDERGIDVVRNTIKDFAKTKGMGDVPFKIIFLDECDSLTKEAQQALRRTMENFVLGTRFILSCNFSSKIIDPIQSRCTVFRFKPLNEEEVKDYVENIAKGEGLEIAENAIKELVTITGGDVRRITNILQSSASITKEINNEIIYSLVSAAQPKEIKEVLSLAINKKFIDARNKLLQTMLNHGLSGLDTVKQIQQEILKIEELDDTRKLDLIDKCGEIEFRMVEGSDEFIQLEALLANFAK